MNGIGRIDEPTDLEEVGRYIRVKGWGITEDSEKMRLLLDEIILGEVNPFIDRKDVKKAFPNIKISGAIGFDQVFPMPELSPGSHVLSLKSVNDQAAQVLCSREIKYNDKIEHALSLVGVEMSRTCNFHCDMCPAHSQEARYLKKKMLADDELIEKIIPLLRSRKYRIKRVAAGAIWGEPLMNRKYFENTERIVNAYPSAFVVITTNGSFLTESNIERILNSGYIRQIAVSVDAGTRETYESIRKGGRWEILIQNLSRLIKEKEKRGLNRSAISTNFVVMKSNLRELPLYIRKMAGLGVNDIGAVNVHNVYSSDRNQGMFDLPWKVNDLAVEREQIVREALSIDLPEGVSLHLPSFVPDKQSAECSFNGASSMLIGIEGEVFPCCVIQSLNYEGRAEAESMGNVFEEELESIWNSRQFINFRLKMLKGEVPNPICLGCPFFYGM